MKSTDIQQIFDRIKALVYHQMVDQNDGICIKAISITGDTLHATVEGVTEGSSYQADVTARIDNGKLTHCSCSVIKEPPPKKLKSCSSSSAKFDSHSESKNEHVPSTSADNSHCDLFGSDSEESDLGQIDSIVTTT